MLESQRVNGHPTVLIVDPMALRRAGVIGFLRDWAEACRVSVASLHPDLVEKDDGTEGCVALCVLNLGGASLKNPVTFGWLKRLTEALRGPPVAIVSDLEDPDEVVTAFRAGARAFIPTSTEPAVALRAFSFIMGGGSFFPPAALLGRLPIKLLRGPQERAGTNGEEPSVRPCALTAQQQAVLARPRTGKATRR